MSHERPAGKAKPGMVATAATLAHINGRGCHCWDNLFLLRPILGRAGQRPGVLEDLAQIAPVDPATAGPLKVLGLVGSPGGDALAQDLAALLDYTTTCQPTSLLAPTPLAPVT